MTMSFPFKLYYDKRSFAKKDEQGQLKWWLENPLEDEEAMSVTIECLNRSGSRVLEIDRFEREWVKPKAQMLSCSNSVVAHGKGHESIAMRITVRTALGVEVVMESDDIHLSVSGDSSGSLNVKVHGSAVVKAKDGNIEIDGDAIIGGGYNASESSAPSSDMKFEDGVLDSAWLAEVALHKVSVSGPDLQRYSEFWRKKGRASVPVLCFVGSDDRRLEKAKVDDSYRIKLRSVVGGYLTLISQGTSGRFIILSPSTLDHETKITREDYFLPSRQKGKGLLDIRQVADDVVDLCFYDEGTERVLMLVTANPILPPMELFTPQGDVKYADKAIVLAIMRQALGSEANAELGYAKICVE